MPIGGYDPDDVEAALAERLGDADAGENSDGDDGGDSPPILTDSERRRYEDGERLLDILDQSEIRRLLDADDARDRR